MDQTLTRSRSLPLRNITLFIAAIVLGFGAIIWLAPAVTPYTFKGALMNPPFQAPDFTLTDQNGQPFHLAEQQRKVVLLFYGFTNCPDICPLTMGNFKQVKEALGKDASRVDFVFITVDPARDSLAVVRQFINKFDPGFIGLTGTARQLHPVMSAYGVYYAQDTPGSSTTDLIAHSDQVYVIDPSGKLRMTYSYGVSIEDMVNDIRHLLQGK
ncbi:MAG: SCO family protein [Omnitrophica WOR_2 bacterium]